MKFLILIWFLFTSYFLFSQVYCGNIAIPQHMYFDEEGTAWNYYLEVDSSNTENIWEIGIPNKTIIDSAYSKPNVLITKTRDSYPINNTSSFYIKHSDNGGFSTPHSAEFAGYYYVNSDSLNDYGLIELSPDNGKSWIDIINDTLYDDDDIYWHTPKPILTGNSNGWQNFWVSLERIGNIFDINYNDTIILKISWLSDNIKDTLDGLAFDNFEFCDGVEGIFEDKFNNFSSKVYPNPSSENIIIQYENMNLELFQLSIFNIQGGLIEQFENLIGEKILIKTESYDNGLFFYRLINKKKNLRSSGKFTISK